MDETIKILIGTISGFIIAFFAEPVKVYFQNRQKRHDMRGALYYEIYNNWVIVTAMMKTFEEVGNETVKMGVGYGIRMEAFEYYISHETALFYQNKEADRINLLNAYLKTIKDWSQLSGKESRMYEPKVIFDLFISEVKEYLQSGALDKQFMEKITGARIKL